MRHPADITPLTFLDYPKKAACIFWFTGCNLRCPYCYNPELVFGKGGGMDEMAFLQERAGFLDAVVLSGGEATLNPDIAELCRKIKSMGYLVKVDTNESAFPWSAVRIIVPPTAFTASATLPTHSSTTSTALTAAS